MGQKRLVVGVLPSKNIVNSHLRSKFIKPSEQPIIQQKPPEDPTVFQFFPCKQDCDCILKLRQLLIDHNAALKVISHDGNKRKMKFHTYRFVPDKTKYTEHQPKLKQQTDIESVEVLYEDSESKSSTDNWGETSKYNNGVETVDNSSAEEHISLGDNFNSDQEDEDSTIQSYDLNIEICESEPNSFDTDEENYQVDWNLEKFGKTYSSAKRRKFKGDFGENSNSSMDSQECNSSITHYERKNVEKTGNIDLSVVKIEAENEWRTDSTNLQEEFRSEIDLSLIKTEENETEDSNCLMELPLEVDFLQANNLLIKSEIETEKYSIIERT